jgi:uncharacterized damage-inducible protein DinB
LGRVVLRRFPAQLKNIRPETCMPDPLIETWAIHNRINLYMLDAIAETSLGDSLGKGRSVGGLFVHMHAVRLMWLKAAAPALLDGLQQLDTDADPGKQVIRAALEGSGRAI